MVHLGRSTCRAMRGRGDQSTMIPDDRVKVPNHLPISTIPNKVEPLRASTNSRYVEGTRYISLNCRLGINKEEDQTSHSTVGWGVIKKSLNCRLGSPQYHSTVGWGVINKKSRPDHFRPPLAPPPTLTRRPVNPKPETLAFECESHPQLDTPSPTRPKH